MTEKGTHAHGAGHQLLDRGSDPRAGNRTRVQRYRAKHRRIEYVPSPDALAIIEAWQAHKLNNCMAGVIDRLILEGHKAMSGNAMSGNGHSE